MSVGLSSNRDPGSPDSLDAAFLAAARPYWHAIGRSEDLDPGSVVATTLLGEDLALWRDQEGGLGLVAERCVHRGTRLSAGTVSEAGCLRCPYHGWEFDTTGACSRLPQLPDRPVPRTARVAGYRVREQDGLVWACLAPAGGEVGDIPELRVAAADDLEMPAGHDFRVVLGPPFELATQAGRPIENSFDQAHFSVLHADIFGNPDDLEVSPASISRSDGGHQIEFEFDYMGVDVIAEPGPDGKRPLTAMHYHYVIDLPFVSQFSVTAEGWDPGTIFYAVQPIAADRCRMFWLVTTSQPDVTDEFLIEYNKAVLMQDLPIVESQRPARLPLHQGAELHMPFDRPAVAYRQALAELGFPVETPPAMGETRNAKVHRNQSGAPIASRP